MMSVKTNSKSEYSSHHGLIMQIDHLTSLVDDNDEYVRSIFTFVTRVFSRLYSPTSVKIGERPLIISNTTETNEWCDERE